MQGNRNQASNGSPESKTRAVYLRRLSRCQAIRSPWNSAPARGPARRYWSKTMEMTRTSMRPGGMHGDPLASSILSRPPAPFPAGRPVRPRSTCVKSIRWATFDTLDRQLEMAHQGLDDRRGAAGRRRVSSMPRSTGSAAGIEAVVVLVERLDVLRSRSGRPC